MVEYRGQDLFFGETQLVNLIRGNQGQACYVYDLNNIKKRYSILKDSLSGLKKLSIHYALKANCHPEISKCLKTMGSSVDVVSGGEMCLALENGFEASDIIFSGVAKSVEEISEAIDIGIKQINVESPQELERIGEIAKRKNTKMAVAFRMNPEVNPVTHPYITTGMTENKFGMERAFLPELVRSLKTYSDHLHLRGLTMHIGSQLLELDAMEEAIQKLGSIQHELEVLGFPIESLDIGGGIGIQYHKQDESEDFALIKAYGEVVVRNLKGFAGEVMIEPGRVLVGRAGVLLCQVEYIKKTTHKTFVIVNTGMHHLMRPALYQAEHRILPLKTQSNGQGDSSQMVYDVVGPICESTDVLAKNRPMPKVKQGDFLAICDVGAYGFSMANNYNVHGLPIEIII